MYQSSPQPYRGTLTPSPSLPSTPISSSPPFALTLCPRLRPCPVTLHPSPTAHFVGLRRHRRGLPAQRRHRAGVRFRRMAEPALQGARRAASGPAKTRELCDLSGPFNSRYLNNRAEPFYAFNLWDTTALIINIGRLLPQACILYSLVSATCGLLHPLANLLSV